LKESSHVEVTHERKTITFFDITGTVHFEFTSQGQTVYQAYYVEMLKRLYEGVHRKSFELWPNDWILHHNNASVDKTLSVRELLAGPKIDYWNGTSPPVPLIWLRMTSGCFQKEILP
jgi:hypothetical protein